MKKVSYSIVMSTLDMASRIEGLPRNICIKLADHFTRGKFKAAIRKGDVEVFTSIKGIGSKTAEKIIEGGKRMLALRPERITVKKTYYMAPMFGTNNTFDKVTQDKLDHISKLKYPSTVIRLLEEIASDNERKVAQPFDVTGRVEYNSLSRSMLSDDLGIEMGKMTDCIAIYRHNANGVVRLHKDLRESLASMDETDPMRKRIYDNVKRCCIALLKRAIASGVTHNGVHYAFYTCSSGQLKKSSCYLMRSDLLRKNKKRYWGGLTPAQIEVNSKGAYIPMTKILQYRALLTSAAVPSSVVFGRPMLLDHCICVGEYEKKMTANVMSISENYEVTEGKRDDLVKNIGDGNGWIDIETWGDVAAQVRGYTIKGFLTPTDIHGYCERNKLSKKIVDIDDVEHDLNEETNISIILNTSVFKGKKLFGTWKNYVAKMKECGFTELYVCAVDEEEEETKQLSRQSMQTLFDIRDDELNEVVKASVNEINALTRLDHARDVLGCAGKDYDDLSNFSKLIRTYPDVIKLPAAQKELRDRYYSLYNKAMYGKVNINGKFFFVAPDPYALLDIQFGGKSVDDPNIGLLKAGECCCNAYPDAKKLTLLRYPHIFMEWVTVSNKPDPRFKGNVIYVSVHDLNDRILQMDYDGDHLLVIDDPMLADIAERTRRIYDVPVLYYEPSVAVAPSSKAMDANAIVECIYKCKELDKVGQYTNLATTAWSFVNSNAQSIEEVREMLKVIAVITAGVNHAVDAQKTYALNKLSDHIIELYDKLPWNQRWKVASGLLSEEDHVEADNLYLPQGDGVVDRVHDVVSPQLSSEYVMRDEGLDFNWHMMEHPDTFGFKCIKNMRVSMADLEQIGSVEHMHLDAEKLSVIIGAIRRNEPISLCDFLHLLNCLNADFWNEKRKEEEGDSDAAYVRATNEWRNEKIRDLAIDFVRRGTPHAANVDDKTVLCFAARWALAKTMQNRKKWGDMRFLFDIFGDLYANAVIENEKILQEVTNIENGLLVADMMRKQDLDRHMNRIFKVDDMPVAKGTACAYLWHMEDVRTWVPGSTITQIHAPVKADDEFNPDDLPVPPAEDQEYVMLANELDDLF